MRFENTSPAMDLRQLEMFRAVAEQGTFTKAAGRLHVSQSAVSRQVQLLEEELGGALLRRSAKGVSLTEAGELLLRMTHRVERDVEEALERLGEAAVSAVIVTSLMMFWWAPEPRYYFSPSRLLELAHASPIAREVDQNLGAPTATQGALAREKELKPGTLMVFDENYSASPSLFWNNTFSNRIKYIKGGAGFLTRAAEAGATWISLAPQDSNLALARGPGSGWQEVGLLNPYVTGYAFRRVGPPPAPPKPAVTPPKHAATKPAIGPLFGPPAPVPAGAPPAVGRGLPADPHGR